MSKRHDGGADGDGDDKGGANGGDGGAEGQVAMKDAFTGTSQSIRAGTMPNDIADGAPSKSMDASISTRDAPYSILC